MASHILPNETIYCRFTGEGFTVVHCDGVIAVLRDGAGITTGRIVGELTRERLDAQDDES